MMTAIPAFTGAALWFLGSPTAAGMHAGILTFNATYHYLCPVPSHARKGMTGTFTVTSTPLIPGPGRGPWSREQASASARSTKRSLPDVGEFAHTQFITARLIAPGSLVSDSGSEMGAPGSCQARSDAVARPEGMPLSCADTPEQGTRSSACLVRDEEAAGSNPATPTQVRGPFLIMRDGPLSLRASRMRHAAGSTTR